MVLEAEFRAKHPWNRMLRPYILVMAKYNEKEPLEEAALSDNRIFQSGLYMFLINKSTNPLMDLWLIHAEDSTLACTITVLSK